MTGYAKSWTDKYNDEWYLSLSLAERGLWDQLKDWAKLHGDTGGIFLSNLSHAGAVFGCDRKTAGRILGKFHDNSKIVLSTSETGIHIEILNYEYYQRLKRVGDGSSSGDHRGKSPEPPPIIRADQTKAKQTRPYQGPTCPLQKIQDLFNRICVSLPQIKGIRDDRLTKIRRQWKEQPNLDWWEKFFVTVEASDFLAGRTPPSEGHANWRCGFDFIITPKYFRKITEGGYQNKTPQAELLSPEAVSTARNAKIAGKNIRKREEAKNEV